MDRVKRRYPVALRVLGWSVFAAGALLLLRSPPAWDAAQPRFLSTTYALETAAAGPVPEERLTEVEAVRLRPGEPMVVAFQRAGVVQPELVAAMRTFTELVDVRRVRPSDLFLLYRSRQGKLRRVEYDRGGMEDRVVLEAGESDFLAYREPKRIERSLRKLEGTVLSNLYESLTEVGGDAGLVVSFADLFAWDFDFFTDTRGGDRFDLIVEEITVDGRRAEFGRVWAGRYWPAGADRPLDAYAHSRDDGDIDYYTADGRSVRKFFLKSPLNFRRISSHFSYARKHPIFKTVRPHLGVDYAAPMGTPVVALGNGKVVSVGWRNGFGRTVQVRHNATYLTQYAHLSAYAKGVRSGGRIRQGDVVGYVGNSGHATGPHLDFRVQENGRWVNPLGLKGGTPEPLPERDRARFDLAVERLTGLLDRLPSGTSVGLMPGAVFPEALAQLDTSGGS